MPQARYYYAAEDRFVIEDYHEARPFCSFLPGIAGETGVPIWAFYVNRGQALAGFGLRDKDGAIQEYVPADKAPWYAAWRGFRTLIKVTTPAGTVVYEPFRCDAGPRQSIKSRLELTPAEIGLCEEHEGLGLEIRVTYFTLPRARVGGLFRRTEILNRRAEAVRLEAVDGLAALLPAGFSDFLAKHMGATIRAWMQVSLAAGVPFHKLRYLPDDVPELLPISHGHFHLGYTVARGRVERLAPIYDPQAIFGPGTDFRPVRFAAEDFRYPPAQRAGNYLPSAFSHVAAELAAGEALAIYGLFGQSPDEESLRAFLPEVGAGYYEERCEINRILVREITDRARTVSGEPLFDRYVGQCALDNVIRGGMPVTLAENGTPKVFWLYSRKHGDLERDYNDFRLSPTFYSQGNGNFRDINQNRRHDVHFNPEIGDAALRYFWNLIQLDGYNPLVVKGFSYRCADMDRAGSALAGIIPGRDGRPLLALVGREFTPGELMQVLEETWPGDPANQDAFAALLAEAEAVEEAAPGAEGYWIDHWIYNLDLFDAFAGIYPDRIGEACFYRRDYTWYDNWVILTPFDRRYRLRGGEARPARGARTDEEKKRLIEGRECCPHLVRNGRGRGGIHRTNLFAKMFALLLNKLAGFDPFLAGMEMEADRPGWCDAVNGLPGMMGSSTVEVFALERLLGQMRSIIAAVPETAALTLPIEIHRFYRGMAAALQGVPATDGERHALWAQTHRLRDAFLAETRLGLDGRVAELSLAELGGFLADSGRFIADALHRACRPADGLFHTYFFHRIQQWGAGTEDGEPDAETPVCPAVFSRHELPLFLEGQVHALRGAADRAKARAIYKAVRESALYDPRLGMYKVCADLSGAPSELGRIKVFPRGWLENESVFLHMEYKYLLEILRRGLYAEFFAELPRLLVCFQDPAVYGRNPLENCSFLVSSAYPEADQHGRGHIARLSGATAEMLHLWSVMSFGERPFRVDVRGELILEFTPVLAASFFRPEDGRVELALPGGARKEYPVPAASYSALFLSRTLVVYENPGRRDTFGPDAARVAAVTLRGRDGREDTVDGPEIAGDRAHRIRAGLVERIDVLLA